MVQALRYGAQQRITYHSGLFFALLPPMEQKIKILTKASENIIILQMRTINDSHICMAPEIWSATSRIFCTFTTLTS